MKTENIELLREFAKIQRDAESRVAEINKELDSFEIGDENITAEALQKLQGFLAGITPEDEANRKAKKSAIILQMVEAINAVAVLNGLGKICQRHGETWGDVALGNIDEELNEVVGGLL